MKLRDGRTVGIIDVPGHERFIKNMVAGATSTDFVMLIVAADDAVMPQTREHLSIMTLLGVRRGIIVVNKIDLVDAEMVELVAEEVRETVQSTFLEGAPVQPVSAETGQGFDELMDLINRMVTETPAHEAEGVFRMPIQRVFSSRGFGTIMTGVPITGCAKVGDTLEILPLGKRGRVRRLNAYKKEVTEIRAGHSSAINLSDVEHREVHRGMTVATPDTFLATLFVEARLKYAPDHPKPLKNFSPVKLHVGTAEADGRIVLLDRKTLEPGEEGLVQFRLQEPVVVADGDRFIVRLQSPMYTIGGGRILDASAGKLRRFRDEVGKRLSEKEAALNDPEAALEFYLKDCGHRLVDLKSVAAKARAPLRLIEEPLRTIVESDRVLRAPSGKFVHRETLDTALDLADRQIREFHEKNQLRAGIDRLQLKRITGFDDSFFAVVLEELPKRGKFVVEKEKVRLASFRVELSREDAEAAAEIERVLKETRFSTPRRDELKDRFPRYNKERIDRVLKLLAEQGAVASLKDGVFLHRDTIEEAREIVTQAIREHGPIEAARVRDLVGTTRKYVIPLLEHLDQLGITVRKGNARVLRPKK